jgi:hypothetical protein
MKLRLVSFHHLPNAVRRAGAIRYPELRDPAFMRAHAHLSSADLAYLLECDVEAVYKARGKRPAKPGPVSARQKIRERLSYGA